MTRDDIIRMAREAGMVVVDDEFSLIPFLERFFHMAQAAEREACAKVCEGMEETNLQLRYEYRRAVLNCADAIRARGQE